MEAEMKMMLAAAALAATMAGGAALAQSAAGDPAMAGARQAYRDSCARFESRDYCECVGSGLSHTLTVAEMGVARQLMVNQATPRRARAITGYDAASLQDMTQRIGAAQSQYDNVCMQFRRGGAPMTPMPDADVTVSPPT